MMTWVSLLVPSWDAPSWLRSVSACRRWASLIPYGTREPVNRLPGEPLAAQGLRGRLDFPMLAPPPRLATRHGHRHAHESATHCCASAAGAAPAACPRRSRRGDSGGATAAAPRCSAAGHSRHAGLGSRHARSSRHRTHAKLSGGADGAGETPRDAVNDTADPGPRDGGITVTTRVYATVTQVWAVLTAYERWAALVPGTVRCHCYPSRDSPGR